MKDLELLHYLAGRTFPFALQNENGSYSVQKSLLTNGWFQKHLDGELTIGTYTVDQNKVWTVTFDIDTNDVGDVYKIAPFLQGPYMVFHSGRKGLHVIQIYEDAIPSQLAYEYGQAVKKAAGLPSMEVFPKQPMVEPGKYGSLTKLPLGIHRVTGNRAAHLLGDFAFAPSPDLTGYATIEKSLMKPKQYVGPGGEEAASWLEELFAGVSEGGGRNNIANKLVWWLSRREFPADLVRHILEYVNQHYFSPPLEPGEIETLLRER